VIDFFLLSGWSLIFLTTPLDLHDHLRGVLGLASTVIGFFWFPALVLTGRFVRAFFLIKTFLRWLEARRNGEETIEETSFYRALLQIIIISYLFCIGTEELVRIYFGLVLLYDGPVFKLNSHQRKRDLVKITLALTFCFTLPFLGLIIWKAPLLISMPTFVGYSISLYDNWKIVRIRKKLY
jgi:hypothetical protein